VLNSAKQKAQAIQCMNNNRQLMIGMLMYVSDNDDNFPPNGYQSGGGMPDEGIYWVAGDMTVWQDATNMVYLTDSRYAFLAPYTKSATLYKCPADKSQTINLANGRRYSRVRTYSMNAAVGTYAFYGRIYDKPVADIWLFDGAGNGNFQDYRKLTSIIEPSPGNLLILLDENPYSIDTGSFAVSMKTAPTSLIGSPGTYHNYGCSISFADGHVELHRWHDARTQLTYRYHPEIRLYPDPPDFTYQPTNSDVSWLQLHITAPK
jgi:prepilin-type processing-associated H-X9-DG protein